MALSLRAREWAAPGLATTAMEVVMDDWHPENNASGIVSLAVAENTMMQETLLQYIHQHFMIPARALTYGDGSSGSTRLKSALAKFLTDQLDPSTKISPEHITITNGASSAIEHLTFTLANPGDSVLLGQPYYGTFTADVTLRTGVHIIPVPFAKIDPFSLEAVQRYREELCSAVESGRQVAGIILCHPHNPLGRCYPRDVLESIMALCQEFKVHLIADEVYALSTFDNDVDGSPHPVHFRSCLSIHTTDIIDPALLHIIWCMSKDFGANGLRIGAIISQHNPTLHAALALASLYSFPSSLSEHVAASILEDKVWAQRYITENRRQLAERYRIMVNWARSHDIQYSPGVNAAFFFWVDLGTAYQQKHTLPTDANIEDVVMERLLEYKVFLMPGTSYGAEEPGWFRIVFTQDKEYLMQGLRRIISAIE